MEKSGAKAYLVNTGWNGTGKRISIKDTRGIIDAILNGAIKTAPTKTIPCFNFEVPTELPGVDSGILDPRDTYANASDWETKAKDLAARFVKNFAKYEGNDAGKALVSAGPPGIIPLPEQSAQNHKEGLRIERSVALNIKYYIWKTDHAFRFQMEM